MRIPRSVQGHVGNLLLLGASVLLVLVGIEVALTLFYPTKYMQAPEHAADDLFTTVLHQRSAVPGLSFELAPNRWKKFKGIPIRTNSLGMRDAEPLPIESTAVSRIVVLGDSFTFGLGVAGASTYPTVLEQQLNDGAGEQQFEVLNLGVSGYNTQDEAVVLENSRQLTESRQIPVLVVIFPRNPDRPRPSYPYAEIHEQIARASREKGFAVIDLLDRFSEYPPETMRVRRGDPHPSSWGHKVTADAIYEWIASELPIAGSSISHLATSL